MTVYINGQWQQGAGSEFQSINPSTNQVVWTGNNSTEEQIDQAVTAARLAQFDWISRPLEERLTIIRNYARLLEEQKEDIARAIAMETGKPLWEARTEATAMKGKIEISIKAFYERTSTVENQIPGASAVIRYKPHGVVAVFGPYNFPGHLPNGHIVPALIAGNCIVYKPSELTPATAELAVQLWEQAGLPAGVLNLVQGERQTGVYLSNHSEIDGLFFTGSSRTGKLLHQQFGGHPGKILALEMGGNNPLIVCDVDNIQAAVHDTIHSAFITAGQRCTCARRLFIPASEWGNQFLQELVTATRKLTTGHWDDDPQPFMGAVISEAAAEAIIQAQQHLQTLGGNSLLEARQLQPGTGMLSPGIIDVTTVPALPDEEYFGPLLQVIRYQHLKDAIKKANNTRYGLSAGLFSNRREDYDLFFNQIRVGIVNWNRPTTGAAGTAPFGGAGDSGNHRPSAYFAADYCSWPVASVEAEALTLPEKMVPGLILDNLEKQS